MERLLIFIKHHFHFLWNSLEWFNGIIFDLMYRPLMGRILPGVFSEFASPPYTYRRLEIYDMPLLYELLRAQPESDLKYFRPHAFDLKSLEKQSRKKSFLMMGAFTDNKMIGYFFLRFFINKKCFVGRLIDTGYRGRSIGFVMNEIMYETAWRMNFRCLSTISRNNIAVIRAHSKNPTMMVVKELQNDYLLVEFVKKNYRGTNQEQ